MAESIPFHRVVVKTLLELHSQHGEGVVRAQRGSEKKQLIVRDGCLSFAESNLQEDHLARILVKMDLLPQETLAKVASLMKEGKPSDQAIREASALSSVEIDRGVREQAVQILASLMGWEVAELRRYGAGAIPKREIHVGIPLPELLVLSARRAVSQRTIPRNMKELGGNLAPDLEFAPALLAIPLDSREALAYSYVQQSIAVEDILPSLAAPGVRPDELIQRLLLLGYLRKQDSAAAAEVVDPAPGSEGKLEDRLDELLHDFETADLYHILSVAPEASDSDIKNSYHNLAREYHPDRFQSTEYSTSVRAKAERVFTHITGAYKTLGDPALRAGYDADRLKKDSRAESVLRTRSTIEVEREKMAEALYRAGRMSLTRDQVDKAVEQLKESVWLKPDVARYHHYLGVAQARNPKLRKEAERHLLKSIELDGMQVEPYIALGKLYISVNLPRRAEMQLQEALRWDPENLEAKKLLQEVATARGDQTGTSRTSKTPFFRS